MELSFKTYEIGFSRSNQQLLGLEELTDLKGRYVYMIETPKSLSIKYEGGVSNVCYIGRQSERSQGSRIKAHAKGWIGRFLVLAQLDEPFIMRQCFPRQRGVELAYRDVEAFLIDEFVDKFGQRPIFNKRQERQSGTFPIEYDRSIFRRRRAAGKIDARKGIDDAVDIED